MLKILTTFIFLLILSQCNATCPTGVGTCDDVPPPPPDPGPYFDDTNRNYLYNAEHVCIGQAVDVGYSETVVQAQDSDFVALIDHEIDEFSHLARYSVGLTSRFEPEGITNKDGKKVLVGLPPHLYMLTDYKDSFWRGRRPIVFELIVKPGVTDIDFDNIDVSKFNRFLFYMNSWEDPIIKIDMSTTHPTQGLFSATTANEHYLILGHDVDALNISHQNNAFSEMAKLPINPLLYNKNHSDLPGGMTEDAIDMQKIPADDPDFEDQFFKKAGLLPPSQLGTMPTHKRKLPEDKENFYCPPFDDTVPA